MPAYRIVGGNRRERPQILRQFPRAVLATAFATFIAFMGIGVVDPILPLIGRAMGATPAQVEWLFTSYIAVMSLAMLLAGSLATRLGGKRTMLLGLGMVVVFASLSGLSGSVTELALVRGGWGLGNAMFTSTALAIIVGLSTTGMGPAITLYEAALGLGIASGPLLGGLLGGVSWRDPFFGTATLMALAFLATWITVREPPRREPARTVRDVLTALGHPAVHTNALIGLAYSFGFFTILAYSPLTLPGLTPLQLGLTYFGWGLLVAFTSVVVVNWLLRRTDAIAILKGDLLGLVVIFGLAGLGIAHLLLWLVVVSGIFCGIANALFTSLAMEVSPYSRSVSSGTYNFLRWAGAAIAPVSAGWIGQRVGMTVPFFVAGAVVLAGWFAMLGRSGLLRSALRERETVLSGGRG